MGAEAPIEDEPVDELPDEVYDNVARVLIEAAERLDGQR
jgi:hypothetical protein